MADEYRWLDSEAAERLLRRESPDDAVPPAAREQAERLSRTLDALSASLTGSGAAEPPSAPAPAPALGDPSGELPGEAAALAAFRAARAEPAATGSGLVRIGRPGQRGTARSSRRRHTVRLGLAAALIVGTVGGVAVAAGTGVLPEPFGGAGPEPATSVSAATPGPGGHPDPTPSPRAGDSATADGSDGGTATGPAEPGSVHGTPPEVAAACRAVRQGRTVNPVLRHTLENRAGGPSRITAYCTDLLEEEKGGSGTGKDTGKGKGNGSGTDGNGNADGNKANSGGTGQGDNGNGNGKGHGQGQEKKASTAGTTGTTGTTGTHRGSDQGEGHGHSRRPDPQSHNPL
ncbi:hypothetical protein AQJ30_29625 [Streptomyces longwoodensis]|uniref:Extensin n=1 Tax=Streptomyces longwoodensis TaxID=68231 RepID=A0A117QL76_9ACTN|nr:hypothetical protein [Streptomyces longwoodensis]KUN34453.1 hypothetical protein AQJ30_29625 [Streptomyces longwoodensis]